MNSQWKLVPVEPTETMVINGFESEPNECFTDEEVWEQYQEMSGCQQAAFRAKLCWAAMLGAAPAATAIPAAWLDPNSIQQGEILSAQAKMNSDLLGQQDRALRFSVPLYAHPDAGDVARLTAERDALQLLLNAADQRIDDLQEDRQKLIAYGRSCGLDEAATVCTRMAHEAYFPPGSRFKHFTPKAQTRLGNLLIEAANAIASRPDGPYDRFKARQQKTAEKSATA